MKQSIVVLGYSENDAGLLQGCVWLETV